jgi:hypothetical protein
MNLKKIAANTARTRRVGVGAVYKHFFWLRAFSTSQTLSTPAHPRVTQSVGRLAQNIVKNRFYENNQE